MVSKHAACAGSAGRGERGGGPSGSGGLGGGARYPIHLFLQVCLSFVQVLSFSFSLLFHSLSLLSFFSILSFFGRLLGVLGVREKGTMTAGHPTALVVGGDRKLVM